MESASNPITSSDKSEIDENAPDTTVKASLVDMASNPQSNPSSSPIANFTSSCSYSSAMSDPREFEGSNGK